MWQPKPGPAPSATISAWPAMGPPVSVAFLAISAIDSGSKSPTLLLAGRTWPSSNTTLSSGTSHIRAARWHRILIALRADSTIAMPAEKVTRLPAVTRLKPSVLVSPMIGRTLSTLMPNSSAAIMQMETREPATSGLPSNNVTVPSGVMLSDAVVSPPRLNQNPVATPRP